MWNSDCDKHYDREWTERVLSMPEYMARFAQSDKMPRGGLLEQLASTMGAFDEKAAIAPPARPVPPAQNVAKQPSLQTVARHGVIFEENCFAVSIGQFRLRQIARAQEKASARAGAVERDACACCEACC